MQSDLKSWRCVSMHDPSGRRGVWVRQTEAGIEIRGGREGDDAAFIAKPGDVLTEDTIAHLLAVLECGAWMQEQHGPDTERTPPRNCSKSFSSHADKS